MKEIETHTAKNPTIPREVPYEESVYNLGGVAVNIYKQYRAKLIDAEHSQIHKYAADLLTTVLLKF